MNIMYCVIVGFLLAIFGCILYLKHDVRYGATIAYSTVAILGIAGIVLILIFGKELNQYVKKWSSSGDTKGVFIRSEEIPDKKAVSYKYIYEYYVDGEQYEFTDAVIHSSEKPDTEYKKVNVLYNTEKPEETMDKEYLVTLLSGPICIIFTLLLCFVLLLAKYG